MVRREPAAPPEAAAGAASFWTAAQNGTQTVCYTSPSGPGETLESGRFSVPLSDACAKVTKDNPDVWAEVAVDGAPLGRKKLGAVPYALEAGHATNADNSTNATTAATANAAGGALKTTINGLAPTTSLPIITGWQSYTCNLTRDGGAPVANQTTTAVYRRVGDSIEVHLSTSFTAAPASGGTWWQWSLPPGLSIDATWVGGGSIGGGIVGQGVNNNYTLSVYSRSTKGVAATANGASVYYVNDTHPIAFDNGGVIDLYFTVQVTGWTTTSP